MKLQEIRHELGMPNSKPLPKRVLGSQNSRKSRYSRNPETPSGPIREKNSRPPTYFQVYSRALSFYVLLYDAFRNCTRVSYLSDAAEKES